MKLFNKKKKGFTIVELVIVIAVIGVLAAILIPTFVGLVNRANVAADGTLVRELNNAIALDLAEKGETKHETMTDALEATKEYGFDVSRISTKASKNKILWDSVHGVFCYLKEDAPKVEYVPGSVEEGKELSAGDYRLWIISSTVDGTYSTYLYNYTVTNETKSFSFTHGLDVGETQGLETLTYVGVGEKQEEVVVYTKSASTTLVVNGYVNPSDAKDGDVVKHYGSAGALNVVKCATGSYHENGKVAFAEISKGRIVLENGSKIEHIHINKKDENTFDKVFIKDNGAEALPTAITRDEVAVTDASGKTEVVTVESSAGTETVYVYGTAATGTTQKITTGDNKQNEDVDTALGSLVLDNGTAGQKALTGNEKTETKTEAVDNATEKEDLASEENANARYWIDIAADEFAGGTGTESDPYLISSARQLALLSEIMAGYNTEKSYANYCDKYYKLTKDIDLNGKIWISIGIGNDGAGINPFKGHIDGNNKTVYNMSSLDATYEELEAHKMGTWSTALGNTVAQDGFVGYAKDASVKNLYIVGAVFENSKFEKSGFVVCCADGNTVLENCHVDSTSRYYGKSNIGGLVGLYKVPGENGLILKNCSSAASITLTGSRGAGFVGALYGGTKMFATDCTFSGTISGDRLGGFVGRSTSSYADLSEGCHFKNCHMLGTLTPNTAGDYGYIEAWQADSTPYITLDSCTYKDATDGMVKAFALTDAHIFGYIEGFHTSAWFGVDGVMCENSEVFENGEFVYEIDFTTNKFTYTVNQGMLIIIQRNNCDFANTSFVGSDGVTFTLQRWGNNNNFNFVNNTQFYDADGNLLDGEVANGVNVGVGINYVFTWDTTLNGWKLAA